MVIVIPEIPIKDKLTLTVPERRPSRASHTRLSTLPSRTATSPPAYAGSSTVRIRRTDLDDWVAALPSDWC